MDYRSEQKNENPCPHGTHILIGEPGKISKWIMLQLCYKYIGKWSEVAQSWSCSVMKLLGEVALCDPVDCSPPGSSVHGIFWARRVDWVDISFSRRSSPPRDGTSVSHITDRCLRDKVSERDKESRWWWALQFWIKWSRRSSPRNNILALIWRIGGSKPCIQLRKEWSRQKEVLVQRLWNSSTARSH